MDVSTDVLNTTTTDEKLLTPTRKRKAIREAQAQLKRTRFLSTFCSLQNWSLPDSIIYYITKNPLSSTVYQKMVKCCKYFFIKNPIIVVKRLYYSWESEWEASTNDVQNDINFTKSKFWVTNVFKNSNWATKTTPNLISSIIPYLYYVDVKKLNLHNQVITFADFVFLSSNVENISLKLSVIKNEDGSVVPLEKIVEILPKVKKFKLHITDASIITPNTVKELLKIPHFSNIDRFFLQNLPEMFGIDAFFDYLKKNQQTKFYLSFKSISDDFKKRLEAIIDEILGSSTRDYRPPHISFDGLYFGKYYRIHSLFLNS